MLDFYDVTVPHVKTGVQLWHRRFRVRCSCQWLKSTVNHTIHSRIQWPWKTECFRLQLFNVFFFYYSPVFNTFWKKEFCSFEKIFKSIFLSCLESWCFCLIVLQFVQTPLSTAILLLLCSSYAEGESIQIQSWNEDFCFTEVHFLIYFFTSLHFWACLCTFYFNMFDLGKSKSILINYLTFFFHSDFFFWSVPGLILV